MLLVKQAIVLCCSVFLVVVTLAAQNPEDTALQTIRPEGIRAHVTLLADDLLEGRGTGTRGHELAAKYVAAQF